MQTWLVLLIAIAVVFGYAIIMFLYQRKLVKPLTQEEFKAGYRKAQLIDLRDPEEFKAGHILGARNIPLTQLKMRKSEIRSDQPVYLYCQNGSRSGRGGQILKKLGITDLYQLQGGFKEWTGKVKAK